jgi:hypothetical protein
MKVKIFYYLLKANVGKIFISAAFMAFSGSLSGDPDLEKDFHLKKLIGVLLYPHRVPVTEVQ